MAQRKWTDEELKNHVNNSSTLVEVIRKLGLKVRAGNYKTVNRYIKKNELDTSHFVGSSHKGKLLEGSYSLKDILTKDSKYTSSFHLKNRLIKHKVLENKCTSCGILPEWNGKKLSMVLDHINGYHQDNRLENLRLLCPNCNSQEPTFCRKNK
jgi:hypothetical protein